ncbi:MAG: DUF4160 domain-containing protein [Gammaproteobacteria bacterium]|nr:MAG: DUF4160 domain-containing protein [Gammaproteobacteria bacterium]UTW43527.1 DUF4160 domain-containing protein [bacterium SCSIO 12844]
MPTVLRIGSYRFFFFSNEGTEPPHIHIQRDRALAKFWLNPVELAGSTSFSSIELRKIGKLVVEHEKTFLESWHEYFTN